MKTFLVLTLSLIICCRCCVVDANSNYGQFSSLFSYEEYSNTILNQNIRKEIRDLDISEWNAIADAMNIMKTVSEEEGQAIYGKYFRNMDSLTCQHSKAVYNLHGDMGHTAPVFFTISSCVVFSI